MHRQDTIALQLLKNDKSTLWTTKYFPSTLSEIPLYKKTQTTVFLTRIEEAFIGYPSHPRVITITGPIGCGKTTLVKAICDFKRFQIVQFSPDEDYVEYDIAKDEEYIKKQFEAFLERSQLVNDPQIWRVLLVDDFVIEDDFKKDFIKLVENYSTDKRKLFPLIWIQDISNSGLMPGNCFTFNFPAASTTVLKRVITRVSRAEGLNLTKEQMEDLLNDNPGDVRLAVNTLQFARNFVPGKYDSLTFFQAIGEVLYIKKKRSPEKILNISHCSPRAMINSLYENALDFYSSIEDYCKTACYFSDADVFTKIAWEVPELGELAATTVMRGIMETNLHRVPNSFSALRSSKNSRLRNTVKCDKDDPFKCWPHQKLTLEQMEYFLFTDDASYQYTPAKNVNKLQPSLYELDQAMKLLELDPIDDSGVNDFFSKFEKYL